MCRKTHCTAINPFQTCSFIGHGSTLLFAGLSTQKLYYQFSYEDAIECYNKVIEINPQYESAWFNKSIALAELGRYAKENN